MAHARNSPSSAERWTSCTASLKAEEGRPDTSSAAAKSGTVAHEISARCLVDGTSPARFLGQHIEAAPGELLEVDQAIVENAERYVSHVRELQGVGYELRPELVEVKLEIGEITGEKDAYGTADCVLVRNVGGLTELMVIDLKTGGYPVEAFSRDANGSAQRMNLQLALYALGALRHFRRIESDNEVTLVKAVIYQPSINHVSEFASTPAELDRLGVWIRQKADETRTGGEYVPNEKNCKFCRARGDCEARNREMLAQITNEFDFEENTLTLKTTNEIQIGKLFAQIPSIRAWLDDIEREVFTKVTAGQTVIGPDDKPMKLVEGRRGARQWIDPSQVEEMVLSWRLKGDPMHVTKLVTPTEAEKLSKTKSSDGEPVIGKTRWSRLSELIVSPPGRPVVALGSDPRLALSDSSDMPEA